MSNPGRSWLSEGQSGPRRPPDPGSLPETQSQISVALSLDWCRGGQGLFFPLFFTAERKHTAVKFYLNSVIPSPY